MTHLIGKSIDRYHILEQLGEGGMATVYKAFDTRLERDVAIKIIRRNAFPPDQLDRILKRFEREAKSLARLSHPNIIKVIDYGEYNGAPYLVMEYMPGGTLKEKLKGKAMQWQEAMWLLIPIAQALEYAHEQKIIHRDIKPSNILLMQKGQTMLTDFGIAKILEVEETATLTGTGVGVGTPEYMAPEQWTGSATAQTDIYSLGVVLYEMVTGRKPYTADTPAAILLKQATEPLPRLGTYVCDLPDAVEKTLLKALARKPQDRYQDTGAFVSAMENLLMGTGQSVRTNTTHKVNKPVESDLDTQDTYLQEETYKTNFQTKTYDETPHKLGDTQSKVMENKGNIVRIPRWQSVFWITLVWIIALALEQRQTIALSIVNTIGIDLLNIMNTLYTITGTMGGFGMALVLRNEKIFSGWKSVLWITLIWTISWAIRIAIFNGVIEYHRGILEDETIYAIMWAVSGAIGGFGTALFLRNQEILSNWKSVLWIGLSWTISYAISVPIRNTIDRAAFSLIYVIGGEIILIIGSIIIGVIEGAIGASIMIWRLRMERK